MNVKAEFPRVTSISKTYTERRASHRLRHLLADLEGIVNAFELLVKQRRQCSTNGASKYMEDIVVHKKTISRVAVDVRREKTTLCAGHCSFVTLLLLTHTLQW